jgi:transposase InsO family protein
MGVSKQAVWAHFGREQADLALLGKIIKQVDKHRAKHPGCGLEKLYWQIQPEGIGRDKFCAWLGDLGYGVVRPKNKMRTTFPAHKVFDNLIEGRVVSGPGQVWQSDITYIKVGGTFYYLTFIIDVYSRRIVGYATSKDLRAEANLRALKQALTNCSEGQLKGLVHHSDRGSQYTDGRYLALLRSYNICISMGKVATDNAYAERINGTIKNEYLLPKQPDNFRQLKRLAKQAVTDYNTIRLHQSLGRQSPLSYEKAWNRLPQNQQRVEMIRSHRTPPYLEERLHRIDTQEKLPYCVVHLN